LRNRYGFRKIYGKSYLEQSSARNRRIKCEQKYFYSNLISASVSSNDFVSFVSSCRELFAASQSNAQHRRELLNEPAA